MAGKHKHSVFLTAVLEGFIWVASVGGVQLQSINETGNASHQQTNNAKDSNTF